MSETPILPVLIPLEEKKPLSQVGREHAPGTSHMLILRSSHDYGRFSGRFIAALFGDSNHANCTGKLLKELCMAKCVHLGERGRPGTPLVDKTWVSCSSSREQKAAYGTQLFAKEGISFQ